MQPSTSLFTHHDSHAVVRHLIRKYTDSLPRHFPGTSTVEGYHVALTGATGNVGSMMLNDLLYRWDITKIYLLNRRDRASAHEAILQNFKVKCLDSSIFECTKVTLVYLNVDFAKKDLNLPPEVYEELRCNLTHIIHSAWNLNFRVGLQAYEFPHISGVHNLINLALASPQPQTPRLVFLSTIGAAFCYSGTPKEDITGVTVHRYLVPEAPVDDPSMALPIGYGQSKFVSERIIVNATERGLRSTVIRIGQLSGMTTNGEWAADEGGAIWAMSCLAMGIAIRPEDTPPFRWTSFSPAASAIVKFSFADDDNPLQYFIADNPSGTPPSTTLAAMQAVSPRPYRLVPFRDWLEIVKRTKPEVPAKKLLPFLQLWFGYYPHSAPLDYRESVKVVPELDEAPQTLELWKKYFRYQMELLPCYLRYFLENGYRTDKFAASARL